MRCTGPHSTSACNTRGRTSADLMAIILPMSETSCKETTSASVGMVHSRGTKSIASHRERKATEGVKNSMTFLHA